MPENRQKIADCLDDGSIVRFLRTLANEQETFADRQRYLTAARIIETPEARYDHKSFDDDLVINEHGFKWRGREMLIPEQRLCVLRVMAENVGHLLTYEKLTWDVYGERGRNDKRIRYHVKHLREAMRLVNAGMRIRSAYGAGYVLERIPK